MAVVVAAAVAEEAAKVAVVVVAVVVVPTTGYSCRWTNPAGARLRSGRALMPSLLMMVTWVSITGLLQFPVSDVDIRKSGLVVMEQAVGQIY